MSNVKRQTGLIAWDGGALRRTGNEHHSSGAIVHWNQREPPGKVAITCAGCRRKRFIHSTNIQYMKWSGLCGDCLKQIRRRNKVPYDGKLPSGSIIHWDEQTPLTANYKYVWVTCGSCLEKRLSTIPTGQKRAAWTGLCGPCRGFYRRARTQDEAHATGTVIHWGERDPDDLSNRVAITCHGCGKKSFTSRNSVRYSEWSGLCGQCIEQRGYCWRLSGNETLPTGSIIHWDERDPKDPHRRVMVTCGKCGVKRPVTKGCVSTRHRDKWSGECRKCHSTALRTFFAIHREQKDNSKLKPQKKRGRAPGAVLFDRTIFLSRVNRIIMEMHKTVATRNITREAVSKELQLQGENIGAMGLKKRLMRCGVTLEWRDYVEAVLSKEAQH